MDVIALHAAGFENAVATLGTALTQEQARMMAKYTKQVIISYDSDEAGQAATRKAVRMLSDVGLDVKILRMDGAKDPDEYIKKRGSDSFRSLLDSSRTGFEFKLESALAKYNLLVAEDKIKASGEMCEYISDVWSGVEREIYIAAVAKRLGISEEGLKNDVEMLRRKKIQAYKDKTAQQARLGAMGVGDKINSEAIKNIKARAAEEAVIGLVLMYEENRDLIMSKKVELTSSDFVSEFHSRAFDSIMKLHEQNQYDFAMLGQFLTPDEMGRLQGLEQKRRALAENGRAVFEECVKTVREEKKLANASADGIDEIRMLLEKKRGAQNK
jgi:DNA primase